MVIYTPFISKSKQQEPIQLYDPDPGNYYRKWINKKSIIGTPDFKSVLTNGQELNTAYVNSTNNTEKDNIEKDNTPISTSANDFNQKSYTEKVKQTFNWLRNNTDYTKKQIAGIMAIIENESSFNPAAVNKMETKKWTGENEYKPGRGLFQWSLGRNLDFQNWYKTKYNTDKKIWASDASVEDQLEFMKHEMSKRPAFLKAMENATTVEEAADAMRRGFENGSANALATIKDLNKYTAVGSPNASGFAIRDNAAANKIYNIIYNTTQEV